MNNKKNRFCTKTAKSLRKKFFLLSVLVLMACQSAPTKSEIVLPMEPKMPAVHAEKVDGGILVSEKDFISLVQYIERMKGHIKELNICIDYYTGALHAGNRNDVESTVQNRKVN
ncbi:MAG: hypothetical protein J1G30_01175 [Spirochaetales bacterium]|nr:hypothetical protein [Spirochaetales bacterium]